MTNPDESALAKETIFDLLKNKRRRRMLRHIDAEGGPVQLTDLAKSITAKEEGVERSELSTEQHKHVYVSLYQTHIPKMEDANVIRYQSDARTVELTEQSSVLFTYLEFDPEDDRLDEQSENNHIMDFLPSSIIPSDQ